MTELITALLLALSQCMTDTECESITADLCRAGESAWCSDANEGRGQ